MVSNRPLSYDAAGNILSKSEYDYTTADTLGTATDTVSYVYDTGAWGDLLKTFDGQAITYDGIGNPTKIGSRTFTWQHGRELATLTENGTTWTNTYNADGLRIKRTDGTTDYIYYYAGGQLVRIEIGDKSISLSYDASGVPMSLYYGGSNVTAGNYYYVTNLQGDVVAILDDAGTAVVTYAYDAWGNILSIGGSMAGTLGLHNPLRYRGYVYDQETGLYYLQSRYYDPAIGRFISADEFLSTGQGVLGNNMFSYCCNNPVIRADYSGASFAIAIGFNFNIFGWGGIFTLNFVSTKEDFGVQYSYYLPDDALISDKENQTVGVDIGPYIGIQYTDKNSMDDLEGVAKVTGGDLLLGGDTLTDENGDYLGWQFGTSAFSLNMHSLYTNTETLFRIPTIDLPQILMDWIFW